VIRALNRAVEKVSGKRRCPLTGALETMEAGSLLVFSAALFVAHSLSLQR
jgi:hypothetical protein